MLDGIDLSDPALTEERLYVTSNLEIILSDMFLLLAGILLGAIIVIFSLAKFLQGVYISPTTKKNLDLNMVRIVDQVTGKELMYLNPRTIPQTLELLTAFFVWKFNPNIGKQAYALHVKRRDIRIMYTLLVFSFVIVVFSLYFIFSVQITG